MTAPFAPGDRVLVECIVVRIDSGDARRPVLVTHEEGENEFWPLASIIRSTPTPASQLRTVAEVLDPLGDRHGIPDGNFIYPDRIASHLRAVAGQLEASAAPKPPTLREAAAAYVARMDADNLCALMEAIAREEGAKP